jgi:hypothetical protein
MSMSAFKRATRQSAPVMISLVLLVVAAVMHFGKLVDKDLSGNIFSEALGILVTVALVDWGMQLRDKQRTFPARLAAYNEANVLLARVCGIWSDMVKASASVPPPLGADLLTALYVEMVVSHLDLDANSGGLPPASWRSRLIEFQSMMSSTVDRIIVRYGVFAGEELIGALTNLEKQPTFKFFEKLEVLRLIDLQNNFYRPNLTVFENFQSEIIAIKELHAVLTKQEGEFYGSSGALKVFDISFAAAVREMGPDRGHAPIAPFLGSARRDSNAVPVSG